VWEDATKPRYVPDSSDVQRAISVAGGSDQMGIYLKQIVTMSIQDIGRPRFALIIGNGEYSSPLTHPIADASNISSQLQTSCSFIVTIVVNQTYEQMKSELKRFKNLVNSPENLKQGRVALVFYSGVGGLDKRGKHVLCPNDKRSGLGRMLFSESLISFETDMLEYLDPATSKNMQLTSLPKHELVKRNSNIFIVDACRSKSSKDVPPAIPSCVGAYVAFSCQPPEVSFDGNHANGNYTTCLLQAMASRTQLPMTELFTKAKALALNYASTIPGACSPEMIDAVVGDFVFQYHPNFKRQVEHIRTEILAKESDSLWSHLTTFVDRNWGRISSYFSGGEEESKDGRK
jgi:hypothetical protein